MLAANLKFLTDQNFNSLLIISVTIAVIGVSLTLINSYTEFDDVTGERVIDTTRVHEGLPTDVTLTPEDFINHPELAEMFDVTNTNKNLDLVLESNEHFEETRDLAVDHENINSLLDMITDFYFFYNDYLFTIVNVVKDLFSSFFN
jgi:hypothetical protein